MSNLTGKLMVSDMDGTLLNKKQEISKKNIEAIEYFIQQGGLFTVATGRMGQSVVRYLDELPINAPAILYNGSLIYNFHEQKPIWANYLDNAVKDIIIEIRENFPGIGIEVYQGEAIYLLNGNKEIRKQLTKERVSALTDYTLDEIPKDWYKILLAHKPSVIDSLEQFLRKDKLLPVSLVRSESYFLELLPLNINKGRALERLMELLDINREDVIAVGDNLNDIQLLKKAGTGIAVANGHQELKKIAQYCSPSNSQHAVARIIGWLDNNKI